jgi:hypothetical protein
VLGTLVIVAIPPCSKATAAALRERRGRNPALYCPGGLISIVDNLRDLVLAFIARRTE